MSASREIWGQMMPMSMFAVTRKGRHIRRKQTTSWPMIGNSSMIVLMGSNFCLRRRRTTYAAYTPLSPVCEHKLTSRSLTACHSGTSGRLSRSQRIREWGSVRMSSPESLRGSLMWICGYACHYRFVAW